MAEFFEGCLGADSNAARRRQYRQQRKEYGPSGSLTPHLRILAANREALLKAAVAAAVLFSLASGAAAADTLVTGAIRDRTGVAVAGARVTALDAAGRTVGTDITIADGTFALDARTAVAAIVVACDYCRTTRAPIADGVPAVVIVERYAAVTAGGPSAADIRALPYRSAADIASLRPFSVVQGDRISDRGLDFDGAVRIDGVPLYRAADGSAFTGLVPAHATAALTAISPLSAPLYGGYAGGGVYDLSLHDPDLSTSRGDVGGAADAVARFGAPAGSAEYAASWDAGDDRRAIAGNAVLPAAGGRLSIDALSLSDVLDHAEGTALEYATDSRRFTTAASASAAESDVASLVSAGAWVRNHGALGFEFGARAMRATSTLPNAGAAQSDAAVYAAALAHGGLGSIAATAAWDVGSDAGSAGPARGSALVASLADDVRLDAHWSSHTGAESNLRIPTFAELKAAAPFAVGADRNLLFEQSLSYADLKRLRVTGMAYTQRTTGALLGRVAGLGVDAAWQIAPPLTLRAWLLRANQSAQNAYGPPNYADDAPVTATGLTRQLVWLMYDRTLRVDAILRGAGLEGDVRIPLGTTYAFAIGSARYGSRRVTTVGMTYR